MSPGDSNKPGDGSSSPDAQFDRSDLTDEDTQPEVNLPRIERRQNRPVALEVLRQAQAEMGTRLGTLEARLSLMVERVIDLMVSDQDDYEVMQTVRKDLAELKAEVKGISEWLKANAGP